MENGKTPQSGRPPASLRERLSQTTELQTLPPETLEHLLNLPDRLSAAAKHTSHTVTETKRDLEYTIERLRRQADRIGWMQTSVIVLALVAGTLGGTAAALVVLNWIR